MKVGLVLIVRPAPVSERRYLSIGVHIARPGSEKNSVLPGVKHSNVEWPRGSDRCVYGSGDLLEYCWTSHFL